MFGLSTAKLIAFAIAAAAIIGFVTWSFSLRTRLEHRDAQLAAICAATRTAANQPKLDCKQVPQQIGFLGQTVTALSNALKAQNSAVEALGQQSADQQQKAAQASQAAQGRAREAEATSTRLNASSRSGEALAKPCAPSRALKEAWQ
jgi:multidrug efflux pump subunit AcrA (membrane-fusion protein)